MNGFLASLPAVSVGYFAARAAVALVLGAAIGLERQWRQRTAGLRTNALVALGAALFELFAVLMSGAHGVDPTDRTAPRHPRVRAVAGLFIPVNRVGGEGGQADRDVLGAVGSRGAVTYPFPGSRMNCLACLDGHLTVFGLHHQGSSQHDGEFVELRALPGLRPARGAEHVRDAQAGLACAGLSDVLIDQLGRLAGGGNPARLQDQLRHDR